MVLDLWKIFTGYDTSVALYNHYDIEKHDFLPPFPKGGYRGD